ncbi:MAG TPA: DUF484 family protein [Caulobacteraceae bacterium]
MRANPGLVRDDPGLLAELGLRLDDANVIDFGPLALSRVNAAHKRESSARLRLEGVARANFGAQSKTHAAVVDLLAARDNTQLAHQVAVLARAHFELSAGVLALEGPDHVPAGWRVMAKGQVDLVLGPGNITLVGQAPTALGLFGGRARSIGSVALVRLSMWTPQRSGVIAFGSADPRAFTVDMGVDLLIFLAKVVERTAERWPAA